MSTMLQPHILGTQSYHNHQGTTTLLVPNPNLKDTNVACSKKNSLCGISHCEVVPVDVDNLRHE
jgi:hypothetical protein